MSERTVTLQTNRQVVEYVATGDTLDLVRDSAMAQVDDFFDSSWTDVQVSVGAVSRVDEYSEIDANFVATVTASAVKAEDER